MLLSLIGCDDLVIVLLTSLSALLYHYSVSNTNVIMSGQCFDYFIKVVMLAVWNYVLHTVWLVVIFFSLHNLNKDKNPNTCLISRL